MSSLAFEFGFKDLIDILLVAVILYETYRLLRKSGVANLFWGVLAFIVVWFLVSFVFQLELTSALFDRVISVGAIALIVIFQEEIRSFFYRIGSRFNVEKFKERWSKINIQQDANKQIETIYNACLHLSANQTGALIIITDQQDLKKYADTGEIIDAALSARLIENIFFKNTPLHDGALIVHNGRIWAAACILPITKRVDLPKQYGLRHRAALGLAEKTDATAIVVSEETGKISIAKGDNIQIITPVELKSKLESIFRITNKA
jgi:uncharacterized protein (TIGR00159 family)